jgi:hypothetical protein
MNLQETSACVVLPPPPAITPANQCFVCLLAVELTEGALQVASGNFSSRFDLFPVFFAGELMFQCFSRYAFEPLYRASSWFLFCT